MGSPPRDKNSSPFLNGKLASERGGSGGGTKAENHEGSQTSGSLRGVGILGKLGPQNSPTEAILLNGRVINQVYYSSRVRGVGLFFVCMDAHEILAWMLLHFAPQERRAVLQARERIFVAPPLKQRGLRLGCTTKILSPSMHRTTCGRKVQQRFSQNSYYCMG